MAWTAEKPTLTDKQFNLLTEVSNSRASRRGHTIRAKIILFSASGLSDRKIANTLNITRAMSGRWRQRWLNQKEKLLLLDQKESGVAYKRGVLSILSDAERPGTPGKFTPEQICKIINVSCERPEDLNLPFSHWSLTLLAAEVVKRKIVESISTSQLCVFLKSGTNKAS